GRQGRRRLVTERAQARGRGERRERERMIFDDLAQARDTLLSPSRFVDRDGEELVVPRSIPLSARRTRELLECARGGGGAPGGEPRHRAFVLRLGSEPPARPVARDIAIECGGGLGEAPAFVVQLGDLVRRVFCERA